MDMIRNLLESDLKGDQIYARLAAQLMSGQLLPGDRLKIRELADEIGTSVTPVRDALLRLVQDGALVMPTPRDIRVRSLTFREYLEIRSIRLELEGMAAGMAAIKATAADVARMEALMAANETALANHEFQQGIALNQVFHFELCRIAEMPLLTEILNRLWMKIGPLIAQAYHQGGRAMVDHHYPVVQALRNRDHQAARIAIQTDLLSGGRIILHLKMQEDAAAGAGG